MNLFNLFKKRQTVPFQRTSIQKIQDMAEQHGWEQISLQPNISMISFRQGTNRINVYYSKMTVGTVIDHPKKGKTQLFRKGVTFNELENIFTDPRVHTMKGYYTR